MPESLLQPWEFLGWFLEPQSRGQETELEENRAQNSWEGLRGTAGARRVSGKCLHWSNWSCPGWFLRCWCTPTKFRETAMRLFFVSRTQSRDALPQSLCVGRHLLLIAGSSSSLGLRGYFSLQTVRQGSKPRPVPVTVSFL